MHCPSCEKLLEGEFKNIPDVQDARVNWKTNSAEIFFVDEKPDFEEIRKTAEKFGYTVFENEPADSAVKRKATWKEWLKAGLIILAILFLYRIFQGAGFLRTLSIGNTSLSYGASFLVGLVASVSSCLAVVGAVVISFSEKYQSEKKSFYEGAVQPNLLFHVGRLGTFFILGGLLGAVGGELNISGNFVSIYTIIIAFVMGWLGLNILGLAPTLAAVGIKMPKKFSARWEDLKKSEHKAAPFVLGGLTFFLPCGFTQSMQLFALASGSFLVGGLSLLFFALGTVPSLLILGVAASWTKNRGFSLFQKVAGILILIFAAYTLNSGFALKGVKTNVISSNGSKQDSLVKNDPPKIKNKSSDQSEQIVTMKVTSSAFEPNVLRVRQGVPIKWIIDGINVTGCTSSIVVPSLEISKNLKFGENIIRFTPMKKGEIPFSCGMGMVHGKFLVE